jgi:hypothetical protein
MALVSSTDYDNLPVEPIPRWLKLRDLLEARLIQATDEREGISDHNLIEYCTVLSSAADELGLGLIERFTVSNVREEYSQIRSQIIALATKLSIRSSSYNVALSVALPRASKTKLFSQIERLRTLISSAELSDKQKKRLLAKLDELHSIIVAPRVEYAKLMAVLAILAAGVTTATAFLADAPDAIATITAVIGEAKEAEEEEERLLEAEKEPLKIPDLRGDDGSSNDIPF